MEKIVLDQKYMASVAVAEKKNFIRPELTGVLVSETSTTAVNAMGTILMHIRQTGAPFTSTGLLVPADKVQAPKVKGRGTTVSFTPTTVTSPTGEEQSYTAIKEKFPDISHILAEDGDFVEATVNVQLLEHLVDAMKSYINASSNPQKYVTIRLRSDVKEAPVHLFAGDKDSLCRGVIAQYRVR